ncbi:hypothetical protein ACQSGA_25765 [Salmonella enterica]|uniref:hypothetical protein n=1 Tax=Salmonella enterica TaxID=28901 RepID=UPI003D316C1D
MIKIILQFFLFFGDLILVWIFTFLGANYYIFLLMINVVSFKKKESTCEYRKIVARTGIWLQVCDVLPSITGDKKSKSRVMSAGHSDCKVFRRARYGIYKFSVNSGAVVVLSCFS